MEVHQSIQSKKWRRISNHIATSPNKSTSIMPQMYTEDIIGYAPITSSIVGGTSGKKYKKKKGVGKGPILKGPELFQFQVPMTKEEKRKRNKRKARFLSSNVDEDDNEKKESDVDEPDFLSMALPSSRIKKSKNKYYNTKNNSDDDVDDDDDDDDDDEEAEETYDNNTDEPDMLYLALSSSRKDKNSSSSSSSRKKKQKKKSNSNNNNKVVPLIGTFVGTNRKLEKQYLRLTTHPKAEDVRPFEVLIKSLANVKTKYYRNEEFDWANEQLKSIRQDVTVQRLRNGFVVDVYETHARILLEQGDLNEFNQCQTVIRYLTTTTGSLDDSNMDNNRKFHHGTSGSNNNDNNASALSQSEEAADEFLAYGLLYSLIQNSQYDLTTLLKRIDEIHKKKGGGASASSAKKKRKKEKKRNKAVGGGNHHHHGSHDSSTNHAMRVVTAVIHDDYRAFFRLYDCAPHMSAYLLDFLVNKMREKAFKRIVASYRPTMSVEYFRETLQFHDLEETRKFLSQSGAVFISLSGIEHDCDGIFWVDCAKSHRQE